MAQERKITVREASIGPVIARADHRDGAIEVNGDIFYKLPPMVQEFILCHEVCHLRYDEHDENLTNARAERLFLNRSANAADRASREEFVGYMHGRDYSNWWQAVVALVPSIVGLGTAIYGAVKNQNSGWYSWDAASKKSNLDAMLTSAFEQSRRSSSHSAAEYFWAQMGQYTNKDDSLDEFLNRSDNAWVGNRIAAYQRKYGFGFRDITPVDLTAYPLVVAAIGALLGAVAWIIIKKLTK